MPDQPINSHRKWPSDDEMVAYALEAPRSLLPHLPELLADLDELGSDASAIVQLLGDLRLPAASFVIDFGCGKGSTSIQIAAQLGFRVLGIELFEPFVAHSRDAARRADVDRPVSFATPTRRRLPGSFRRPMRSCSPPLAMCSARRARRCASFDCTSAPGGFVIVADVFLREGGSTAFEGFEYYLSHSDTVKGLTAWGDTLVREIIEPESAANHDEDEAASIRRRASQLALRHPELETELFAFAQSQADANAHISANLVGAVWAIEKA